MNNLPVQKPSMDSPADKTQSAGRDIAIDYLRSFVIVLVIYIHAALAYTTDGWLIGAPWFLWVLLARVASALP